MHANSLFQLYKRQIIEEQLSRRVWSEEYVMRKHIFEIFRALEGN